MYRSGSGTSSGSGSESFHQNRKKNLNLFCFATFLWLFTSVPDQEDPYVFGHPGSASGSDSQRYGSEDPVRIQIHSTHDTDPPTLVPPYLPVYNSRNVMTILKLSPERRREAGRDGEVLCEGGGGEQQPEQRAAADQTGVGAGEPAAPAAGCRYTGGGRTRRPKAITWVFISY